MHINSGNDYMGLVDTSTMNSPVLFIRQGGETALSRLPMDMRRALVTYLSAPI